MSLKKITVLTFCALLIGLTQITSAQEFREEEKTFELPKDGTVYIDTYKGSINVEAWDKAEVYVHAKIEAENDSWSSTNPEEQLENVKIKYDVSGTSVTIQSKYDKLNNFWGSGTRASVHYKIKMPKTARLQIDDYKSITEINNLESDLIMETYKGRVDVVGLKGSVELETYKGDVTVDFNELKNNCSFETFKGQIELSLNSNSKFDLDIDLGRRGDFRSDFEYSTNGRMRDDEVRGSVNGGGHRIEFETNKGDLRIREK